MSKFIKIESCKECPYLAVQQGFPLGGGILYCQKRFESMRIAEQWKALWTPQTLPHPFYKECPLSFDPDFPVRKEDLPVEKS